MTTATVFVEKRVFLILLPTVYLCAKSKNRTNRYEARTTRQKIGIKTN